MSRYELQERKGERDVTVEWTYDSSTEAIAQGRRNAESQPGTVWEVTKIEDAAMIYEVVWSSEGGQQRDEWEYLQAATERVRAAKDELRAATEALVEHSGNGWPITPAEVSAAQRRWDEALDEVVARAMYHGQLYDRV